MKLLLLTGFLGSGKTTLLNYLLGGLEGQKIGILVNEFGQLSIDGKLVKRKDVDLLEITGGSVFCSCLKENFITGMAEMAGYDLDYLLVEASGVADPSNMGRVVAIVEKISGKKLDDLGSVCIVDAASFLEAYEVIPAIERQLISTKMVIVNKVDCVSGEKLNQIKRMIQSINPEARLAETVNCRIPLEKLLSGVEKVGMPEEVESLNTWKSRPASFVIRSDAVLDYKGFLDFLKSVAGLSYRIKGFALTDQGSVEISGVGDDIRMKHWEKEIPETQVVIISAVGIHIVGDVFNAWKKYLGSSPMDFR